MSRAIHLVPYVALPLVAVASIAVAVGCSTPAPATTPPTDAGADTTLPVQDTARPPADTAKDGPLDTNFPDPFTECTRDPGPGTVTVTPSETGGDPVGGADKFTMEMALKGFPTGAGVLKAAIKTQLGIIVCTLDEARAPVSVANFVGLARGTRPYEKDGAWVVGRFYDGLKWHRIIAGFVIQGGDPLGTGSGGPGYSLPNENHLMQTMGALSMAAGSYKEDGGTVFVPSGSQFFIVSGSGPASDYNVFGRCETPVVEDISYVETKRNDSPVVPIHMMKIDIARCP